jgi:hypothetical protein
MRCDIGASPHLHGQSFCWITLILESDLLIGERKVELHIVLDETMAHLLSTHLASHSTPKGDNKMKSETNQLSTKLARVQAALKGNPLIAYPGVAATQSDESQSTKSWGPAMRV